MGKRIKPVIGEIYYTSAWIHDHVESDDDYMVLGSYKRNNTAIDIPTIPNGYPKFYNECAAIKSINVEPERLATWEERQWLFACKLANELVPFEQLSEIIDYEAQYRNR